jgi:hypothetical protein
MEGEWRAGACKRRWLGRMPQTALRALRTPPADLARVLGAVHTPLREEFHDVWPIKVGCKVHGPPSARSGGSLRVSAQPEKTANAVLVAFPSGHHQRRHAGVPMPTATARCQYERRGGHYSPTQSRARRAHTAGRRPNARVVHIHSLGHQDVVHLHKEGLRLQARVRVPGVFHGLAEWERGLLLSTAAKRGDSLRRNAAMRATFSNSSAARCRARGFAPAPTGTEAPKPSVWSTSSR